MKKGIALAAVALLVVGLATTAFAHGPRRSGAYGPGGYGHMMGMGQGHHMGWASEEPPCWTEGRTATPEEKKELKERSKTYVERYLERFLPDYKLAPKTETPKKK